MLIDFYITAIFTPFIYPSFGEVHIHAYMINELKKLGCTSIAIEE